MLYIERRLYLRNLVLPYELICNEYVDCDHAILAVPNSFHILCLVSLLHDIPPFYEIFESMVSFISRE